MPASTALRGLIVRGTVREIQRYKQKAEPFAPMVNVRVIVEGDEFKESYDCNFEAENLPEVPAVGSEVEIDVSAHCRRDGSQQWVRPERGTVPRVLHAPKSKLAAIS